MKPQIKATAPATLPDCFSASRKVARGDVKRNFSLINIDNQQLAIMQKNLFVKYKPINS